SAVLIQVLRLVVVERVSLRDDLTAHRRDRLVVAQHRALDLADRVDPALNHDLPLEPESRRHRTRELLRRPDLRDPAPASARRGRRRARPGAPLPPPRLRPRASARSPTAERAAPAPGTGGRRARFRWGPPRRRRPRARRSPTAPTSS